MRGRKLVFSSSMKLRCLIIAILLTFGLVVTQLAEVRFIETGKQSDLATRVDKLVSQATQDRINEAQAFSELESMGDAAVPFIVSHLGNMQVLPDQQISISNRSAGSVEKHALYGAEVVHDALSAILRQMTDQNIGAFELDGTPEERNALRQSNWTEWVKWCQKKYPARAKDCGEVQGVGGQQ